MMPNKRDPKAGDMLVDKLAAVSALVKEMKASVREGLAEAAACQDDHNREVGTASAQCVGYWMYRLLEVLEAK